MKKKKSATVTVHPHLNMNPNTRFNTSQPLLQTLGEEGLKYGGHLSDNDFIQALHEYEREDEDAIFKEMMDSETYKFHRVKDGWQVSKIA